jgi:hypothetical protein
VKTSNLTEIKEIEEKPVEAKTSGMGRGGPEVGRKTSLRKGED